MKTEVLFVILTCVNLLLVEGLNSNSFHKSFTSQSNPRILHGNLAIVSEFPYLVKLDTGAAFAAGSIITNYWILTAGHCVYQVRCSDIDVFPATWAPGESARTVDCFAHDRYSTAANAYDIGLIKVAEDILRDGRARAIPLPPPGTVYPRGKMAIVGGWGETEAHDISSNLLWGLFRIEDWSYCNNRHLEITCEGIHFCNPRNLPRRILCLQGQGRPATGTCFGDSGGATIVDGHVAGIVSFGDSRTEHCEIGAPSMHTSVVDYLPWIYSYINPQLDTSGIRVKLEPEY